MRLWKRVSSIPFIANMSTILFLLYVPGTFFSGSTATFPQHRNGNAIAFVWDGLELIATVNLVKPMSSTKSFTDAEPPEPGQ
ncbi:hypothetical protein JB92DRAFT_28221 [Gautieria morchelliformis]|nr:hypothetical protein JB92DRAFT_28221 [Gautieria morchelliformis]